MSYPTKQAAQRSLREFSPWMRKMHVIVKFWSEQYQAHRWARVLVSRGETVSSGV
jgi:hypothetical protein